MGVYRDTGKGEYCLFHSIVLDLCRPFRVLFFTFILLHVYDYPKSKIKTMSRKERRNANENHVRRDAAVSGECERQMRILQSEILFKMATHGAAA